MLAQTENQRECFRVTYPLGARPRFENLATKESLEVEEISEGGFRTTLSFTNTHCGDSVLGVLRFADHSANVDATVKRTDSDCTVYVLSTPLTTIELLREQAAIRRNFPSSI